MPTTLEMKDKEQTCFVVESNFHDQNKDISK